MSLAAGLARERLPILQRSIRYHRPRAPFCGVGVCTQCLVRVNGVPNVRACTYRPEPDDAVRTENSWPSPRRDLLGVLDAIFLHGIDTLHGFRRPVWAMPLYHQVVRRLAGYGRLPELTAPRALVSPEPVDVDTLIVGAGPSGRAAAERLVESRSDLLLVDRGPLLAPPDGARPMPETTVVFLPPPNPGDRWPFRAIGVHGEGPATLLRTRRVLLAPGAYDGSLLFGGNDRPGVLTAEGALAFRAGRDGAPFRRALLFGGGRRVAELLDLFGVHVQAVAAPGPISSEVARRASELEIPLFPRTLLLEAAGRGGVRAVRLRPRGPGATFSLAVDAVVLAHRRVPNAQLFFQVGARMHWRGGAGAYFPVLDEHNATSVPGLFAAGEAAGFSDPVAVEASGVAAAEAALGRSPRLADLPPRVSEDSPYELEGYYRELLAFPRGLAKWIVCACEDVLLREVEEAVARGYRGVEVSKRYTGAGTGLCQGRYCLPDLLIVLALREGRSPAEVGYITQRPPVVPAPLDSLAGIRPEGVATVEGRR